MKAGFDGLISVLLDLNKTLLGIGSSVQEDYGKSIFAQVTGALSAVFSLLFGTDKAAPGLFWQPTLFFTVTVPNLFLKLLWGILAVYFIWNLMFEACIIGYVLFTKDNSDAFKLIVNVLDVHMWYVTRLIGAAVFILEKLIAVAQFIGGLLAAPIKAALPGV